MALTCQGEFLLEVGDVLFRLVDLIVSIIQQLLRALELI